jgi:pyruvate/2-oxoglutarate dehydrogenase complex dihydrolipoamide acyltransferase (E2) component
MRSVKFFTAPILPASISSSGMHEVAGGRTFRMTAWAVIVTALVSGALLALSSWAGTFAPTNPEKAARSARERAPTQASQAVAPVLPTPQPAPQVDSSSRTEELARRLAAILASGRGSTPASRRASPERNPPHSSGPSVK